MKWVLLLFTVIYLTSTKYVFAQGEIPPTFNQQMLLSTQDKLKNVAGSPYLYEEFKTGVVYYDGKYKTEQLLLRLNIYNDQLEYKGKEGVLAFGNPHRIDKVVIEDEVFIFISKRADNKIFGYVRKLNTELPSILTKTNVEFFKREDPKPFDFQDAKPDRLERLDDRYYLMKNYDDIKRFTSVKKLVKYLGKYSAELTQYSKEAGISINDPESLVKLINYYHQVDQKP